MQNLTTVAQAPGTPQWSILYCSLGQSSLPVMSSHQGCSRKTKDSVGAVEVTTILRCMSLMPSVLALINTHYHQRQGQHMSVGVAIHAARGNELGLSEYI